MSRETRHEWEETGPTEVPDPDTRLEAVEEIRPADQVQRTPTVREQLPGTAPVAPFRPVRRPPLAMLCALDDGREDGEWLRIRKDHFVIGRTEGDLVIPHDTMISSRHAEITRQAVKGRYRWYLADLESTNGTYVRVSTIALRHGQEVLMGAHRFRFEAAPEDPGDSVSGLPAGTRAWQPVVPADVLPSLVELTIQGEGHRFCLEGTDVWIGRDARYCSVFLANDALISPRHARLHRDAQGRWILENAGSLNGTWLRIPKLLLDVSCQFQLGEQRFLLKILG